MTQVFRHVGDKTGIWRNLASIPWKETYAVLERHHLIDLVVHNGIAISQAARSLGISRKTVYKWLARYKKRGCDGLVDQSRVRHTQNHSTPIEIRNLLVELSKKSGVRPRQLLWKARRLMLIRTPQCRGQRIAISRRDTKPNKIKVVDSKQLFPCH